MDYTFKTGKIGIKIKNYSSIAKTISIIRKYNPISIAQIKEAIASNNYVLECSYISHPGVRTVRKCYDELMKAGTEVAIYEHDELTTRDFLSNLIDSHRQTTLEVLAQVDSEVENSEL